MQQLVGTQFMKNLQATCIMFNWHYKLKAECLTGITGHIQNVYLALQGMSRMFNWHYRLQAECLTGIAGYKQNV
jgi:hypothetical protein